MAAPTNILQQVQTYQRAHLALLQNQSPFIATANTRFKDFDKIQGNLGSTVTFDRPPRFSDTASLVVTFQSADQLVQTLTVDQPFSVAYEFTAQERIFNVEKDVDSYMEVFGKSAVARLGSRIESVIAQNCNSSVPVRDANGNPTGALHVESGPYRFFGNGITPINSFTQLAQMIANFKNFGAVREGIKSYLYDLAIPNIVGTGLNQFALDRNNEIAMSWQVGEFGTPPSEYYQSNQLPVQNAGTVGNGQRTLTVVSTNDPSGQNITQITFSDTTANDANSVFAGDLAQFQDGVSGLPNLRFLTYMGPNPSGQPVQIRAIANAATVGNAITVSIYPALTADPNNINGGNIAITSNIVAGLSLIHI